MRELSEWTAYRFRRVEPEIVDKLRDQDFQFSEAEIPAEIKQVPAAFFKALNTCNYSRAWELG